LRRSCIGNDCDAGELALSDQQTNPAGSSLGLQRVPFEDLYRFSLSNDNFAPSCGELCWVLGFGLASKRVWRPYLGETTVSQPLWKQGVFFFRSFAAEDDFPYTVFDGWLRVGTKVVAN